VVFNIAKIADGEMGARSNLIRVTSPGLRSSMIPSAGSVIFSGTAPRNVSQR
jgi:hypothetical protein